MLYPEYKYILSKLTTITPVKIEATKSQTSEYLARYIFGSIEILLLFRLVLKIAGASFNNWFVSILYTITRFFVMPFEGIFRKASTTGLETTSIFEPATIVAIIVYAVISMGVVKLIRISSGEEQPVE